MLLLSPALQVTDAWVHNSFISDCACPRSRFHSVLHFIPPSSMFPFLSLSLSIHSSSPSPSILLCHSLPPSLLSVIIISISLTISLSPSVPSYEIKHESIIHSLKHIYHRRVLHRAPYLQSFIFFFTFFLFFFLTTHTVPSEKHHNAGECFFAVQALTRVVREAVKIPLGDSTVITIAVPA